MTATLGVQDERYRAGTERRRPRLVFVGVLLIVVLGVGQWWYRAGSFLHLTSATVGFSTTVGRTVNVGFDVWTSGSGAVTIHGVDALHVPGLRIRFVGVAAPEGEGVGLTVGPVAYRVPLDGRPVARDATSTDSHGNHFQIVMRVRAQQPGDYAVRGVTVRYSSGLRNRTAEAEGSLLCLTVTRPGDPDPRPADPMLHRCGV